MSSAGWYEARGLFKQLEKQIQDLSMGTANELQRLHKKIDSSAGIREKTARSLDPDTVKVLEYYLAGVQGVGKKTLPLVMDAINSAFYEMLRRR